MCPVSLHAVTRCSGCICVAGATPRLGRFCVNVLAQVEYSGVYPSLRRPFEISTSPCLLHTVCL